MAGLGVSGALMVGGLVTFLILIGIVTFDAWPHASGLFSDDAGAQVVDANEAGAAEAASAALASASDLVADAGADAS